MIEADPGRRVARLSSWAAQAGLLVARVEAGPSVAVVVVGHRDQFGRVNTELAGSALATRQAAHGGDR